MPGFFDDYDRDRFEDVDDEPYEPRCKFCGSTAVRWRHQGGQWVQLCSAGVDEEAHPQPGVEHRCSGSADVFDNLDAAR